MRSLSCCGLLLLPLVLFPCFAQADSLNNGALGVLVVIPLFLLGLAGLTVGLTLWSYLRPMGRGLYWMQLLLLGLSLFLGLLQERFFSADLPLLGQANPLLQLCVPLGLWLNGVVWAHQARRETTSLLGLAVAVLALHTLLMVAPAELLNQRYQQAQAPSALLLGCYRLLAFGLGVGSWWVVLRQLVRASALNGHLTQPWWRAPAVAAVVDLVYFGFRMSFLFGNHGGLASNVPWAQLIQSGLLGAVFTWAAGVIALQLAKATFSAGKSGSR